MSKKTIHICIILLVIATNLFFGLPRIAQYTAGDETLWSYDRVPKFWRSVAKANWRGTNLCDKPGITLAMISGAGLPFIPDPRDYEDITRLPKTPEQLNAINQLYFALRLPVYLFTLISLFFFYFLLKRLLSDKIALFSTIFIGLSPILLGISLIVNTDALLWILMPLSIISFLIYQKEANRKFLYLGGFLLGLGILDKFVANLLFPFLLALVFVKYIFSDFENDAHKVAYFQKAMRDYLILVAISLLTIFVFYPSAWIKPRELLNTTIYSLALVKIWPLIVGAIAIVVADVFVLKSFVSRKLGDFFANHKVALVRVVGAIALSLIAFTLLNTYAGMKFLDFELALSDPKGGSFGENFLSAFFPLLFGLTPLIFLLFIFATTLLAKIKKTELEKNNSLTQLFIFILFILIYYVANSISATSSTVRYQIVNYPIASIIAAIGLHELLKHKLLEKYFLGLKFYLLLFFIFVFSIISLAQTRPFFLAYASNLLPEKFITNLKDMGDGSWETSQYLNSLPNAKDLVVWSDKKQVCEKFIGKCASGSNLKNDDFSNFDYLISSRGGSADFQNKLQPIRIGTHTVDPQRLYAPDKFYDFKVNVDGRKSDFVKVVNPLSILSK